MTPQRFFLTAFVLCLSLASPVQAALVTALPGSVLIDNPSASRREDLNQTGPKTYAPGITWTSDVPAAFGTHRLYPFQDNGIWYGMPMIGLTQASGTMRLSFAEPVAGIGGFFNYAQIGGVAVGDAPTIAIFDADNQLLESHVLDFDTGKADLSGFFYGFDVGSALISSFTMSGAYIGMTDLRVLDAKDVPTDVPEPGTILLTGAALLAIRVTGRRKPARSDS